MQKNESDRSVANLNKAIKIDESQIQNHLPE
ncbi:hypothetical protein STSP2_01950 [Anaerohalosphaera lusitana]|uniref:Uncharacterized protein n=1 Tax=Anaerohalosphaera lusitana TaxID=1936003 RepID=A0A1U9NLV0_9BACT|nr:hypothetical protein STSP2_01950 [Anaerohalosphaera lusitana]